MPESVRDRPTKSHEHIFLLAKSARYYYDAEAVKEPITCDRMRGTSDYQHVPDGGNNSGLAHGKFASRNKRDVWTVTTKPYSGPHYATFPPDLIEPCILAGCPQGGTVLDPFCGTGVTCFVAANHHRRAIGIDLDVSLAVE